MKISGEEFKNKLLNKSRDIAVNCKTQEGANKFCAFAEGIGIAWQGGYPYTVGGGLWDGVDTCFTSNGKFCPVEYYLNVGTEIIEFSNVDFSCNKNVLCIKDVIYAEGSDSEEYWERAGEVYEVLNTGISDGINIKPLIGSSHCILNPGHCFFDGHFILMTEEDDFKKQFLNKDNKVAVHCKTEEEATKFCTWMDSMGLSWASGLSYCDEVYFDKCGVGTYYTNKGQIVNLDWAEKLYKVFQYSHINFNDNKSTEEQERGDMKTTTNEYEVVKPFTFKDILSKNLCNSEKNKAMVELFEAGYDKIEYFNNWSDLKGFNWVKDNLSWLEDNAFIQKVKPEFKPFTLELPVNSKEELESLFCRLHMTSEEVKDVYTLRGLYCSTDECGDMHLIVVNKIEELHKDK